MKRKALKLLFLLGAAAFLLGGCKKEAPAVGIMKEAVKNTNKAESFSGNMAVDAGIGMKESGVSVGLDLNMDMDIEAVRETGSCHMKGTVKTGFAGLGLDVEIYNVPGEDKSETVTYTNIGGSWAKATNDVKEENAVAELMNLESYIENGGKLTLEKETGKENGKEVFVITTSVGSGIFKGAEVIMGSMLGDAEEGLNLKDAKLNVTFRIYKDSRLPASVSMALTGKDGESFVIPDKSGNEIELKNLHFLLNFKEFDCVDTIEVPPEALDAQSDSMDIMGNLEEDDFEAEAQDLQEPDLRKDEDGNYILTDWEKKKEVSIPARDGLAADQYSEETHLCFYKNGENPYSVTYTLETLYGEEDKKFFTETKKSAKEMYEKTEGYSDIRYQEEQSTRADGREIGYVTLSYTYNDTLYRNEVYAWTMIDDEHMLICEIGEYPESKENYVINESLIKELFEGIKS